MFLSFLSAYAPTPHPLDTTLTGGDSPTHGPPQEGSPAHHNREQDDEVSSGGSFEARKSLEGKKESFITTFARPASSTPHQTELATRELQAGVMLSQSVVSDGGSLRNVDLHSMLTTSTEAEFQRDLASLDAEIARLQIQFKVAFQDHRVGT